MHNRRKFVQQLSMGAAAMMLPFTSVALTGQSVARSLKFGMVADPHRDLIPDADRRLDAFMEQADLEKPDFIINLGDFCFGKEKNKSFLQRFRQFTGPGYHVLGNHDMDMNTKAEMVGFLGMSNRYYSFDCKDYHFVVLDANHLYQDGKFIDYQHGNFYVDDAFREFIDDQQIEWFKADIAATGKPVIVFSHQSLSHYLYGVKNRLALQLIMEEENRKAGFKKVFACFNGHDHIDLHREMNGINYFEINSLSYQWFGVKNLDRYEKKLYEEYKSLPNIAMYKDPLYAFVTISNSTLTVKGVRSTWVPPSPYDTGVPKDIYGNECTPVISDYSIKR
ncbi:calcineurin-like phosphoesterase family protein [Chitinophaga niastensis]|uniref:Calcineurin-like phosphoesterase family protein n=1 Tax=Chitinophaga niastensis TaxID=536980 RepID=A0A2P8HDU5_CHINA|nr:metallophosphoesterase [Chitinophaga niastensis]PSL44387.1 calcineurin-like phosphoesterase family protein [Chitinophaga niastensis]